MALKVITREDAKAKGLVRFFTGIPCRRGHICERYVKAYTCVECSQLEQRKEKVRAYDAANKFKRKQYFKAWRLNNRERVNHHSRKWAKEHPEKHAARSRLRRARQRNAIGNHSVEEIFELLKKQNFKCVGCNISVKKKYEVDHITPISRGGSNDIANLQILCISCNRKKNAKDPIVWARENGRLL